MPELEPQPSQGDPIASLHKMSTTAGIATTEYVAINSLAITAAVLGLGTSLAFLGLPFILLGFVAVGLGVVAWRQIAGSNGTQGGRWLAVLGIILSLLLGGGAVAQRVAAEVALRPDKQAAGKLIEDLGRHLSADEYVTAYKLCDTDFQKAVTEPFFEQQLRALQNPKDGYGRLLDLNSNGVFEFLSVSGRRAVRTMVISRHAKAGKEAREVITLVQLPDGQWRILHITGLFNRPDQKQ